MHSCSLLLLRVYAKVGERGGTYGWDTRRGAGAGAGAGLVDTEGQPHEIGKDGRCRTRSGETMSLV
jgi:hypothetical protein